MADIYRLTEEDIRKLDKFKDLSTRNLLQGIEASKSQAFERLLFGLGIRYVGQTVAEKLADQFQSIEALKKATYEDLIGVPEIGERIAESVVGFFRDPDNLMLIESLKEAGLKMKKETSAGAGSATGDKLRNLTFVISGIFKHYEREELKDLIKSQGGKVLSSVSSRLDYLVAGENMGPSKLEKAKELGIKIISEKEFEALLRKA